MLRLTKPSARQKIGFPDTSRTTGRVLDDLDGDVNHFRDRQTSGKLAKLYWTIFWTHSGQCETILDCGRAERTRSVVAGCGQGGK
jgi:hypothetical protein